jgi:hypothetical protein
MPITSPTASARGTLRRSATACRRWRASASCSRCFRKKCLTTTQAAHGNSLCGEIVASSYLGTSLHLRVRTGAIGDMTVTVPAWRLAIPPESGRQVWLSWDRDASVVVHPD